VRQRHRPSTIRNWPDPFDAAAELDWGVPRFGRRLLSEHLDQSHDGASRRETVVAGHIRRLRRLLPAPPASILDAGCGPGLYALRLAALGHSVTGVDVNASALSHARRESVGQRLRAQTRFRRCDLRELDMDDAGFDAALLVYYVLEAFPRADQPRVLRRVARALRPGGLLIAELRLRPDQPPGRTSWWETVDGSVLSARRHLLLGDATYEPARHTYVLREAAIFDDGRVALTQTSGWLCPYDRIPRLFGRGGFAVMAVYDGWTGSRATALSESVLVVARASSGAVRRSARASRG